MPIDLLRRSPLIGANTENVTPTASRAYGLSFRITALSVPIVTSEYEITTPFSSGTNLRNSLSISKVRLAFAIQALLHDECIQIVLDAI